MKATQIMTAIAFSISSLAFAAENDPQVNVNNYKHSMKAAKAQAKVDAQNGKEITQASIETENAGNYKNNFKKSEVIELKTTANKEVYPSNAKPEARNYKNQFQNRSK
ncbi:hypothetical protein [Cytophaga hutchinsonii]|uniref:Uncharacterized protein n=1 Tax=Cytophaga hutchinsonii (strain ATCC 33406 / DSM 1761 / CIP 103989 / NBRC 15051 / NCIMB 9469 / D465) TaxID=269798 RepID=A0A6N4SU90_CYTH3|nr:hypothetical protein [Cytophaga hutchinsonii]ABG60039.1 hypothetical protein CHU_2790 [Cytophaga hutchinsonii ATCC 33406]SFX25238.1 hypothetical protein SAMN04487930_102266 [Cytophaga hutchinsonii ATCC 33406]